MTEREGWHIWIIAIFLILFFPRIVLGYLIISNGRAEPKKDKKDENEEIGDQKRDRIKKNSYLIKFGWLLIILSIISLIYFGPLKIINLI